jgi:predicted nucleotidyltransferase
VIRWADYEGVQRAVESLARRIRDEHPGVRAIHWYGSWPARTASPSSDVDLCIIIEDDDRPPRARTPDYLPSRFPVPLDLTVLTEAEWRSLPERAASWHRAITGGVEL